jgi:hypothetical protein
MRAGILTQWAGDELRQRFRACRKPDQARAIVSRNPLRHNVLDKAPDNCRRDIRLARVTAAKP